MSGSGGGGVASALFTVAQIRIVRILLWIIASLLALMGLALPARADGAVTGPMGLAILVAVIALGGALKARKANPPSPIRWMVFRMALGLAGLGIVALLYWLRNRGRKVEALPPPPKPEEIDRLARLEQEEERAA